MPWPWELCRSSPLMRWRSMHTLSHLPSGLGSWTCVLYKGQYHLALIHHQQQPCLSNPQPRLWWQAIHLALVCLSQVYLSWKYSDVKLQPAPGPLMKNSFTVSFWTQSSSCPDHKIRNQAKTHLWQVFSPGSTIISPAVVTQEGTFL